MRRSARRQPAVGASVVTVANGEGVNADLDGVLGRFGLGTLSQASHERRAARTSSRRACYVLFATPHPSVHELHVSMSTPSV
eukprot:scaffold17595_cov61-Phaeocystis_antarctica.AAC.5